MDEQTRNLIAGMANMLKAFTRDPLNRYGFDAIPDQVCVGGSVVLTAGRVREMRALTEAADAALSPAQPAA